MILIADSGSTKTNWTLFDSGIPVQCCRTRGINPYFMNKEEIIRLLEEDFILNGDSIASIHFYGAGCTPEKLPLITEALQQYFGITNVSIYSDLLAAAHSLCHKDEGIVCILGTGSNSGYYDGKKILHHVSPLGYVLGDEGSGAVLGRKLIADVLKKQLRESIIEDFFQRYKLTQPEIIHAVYCEPFPNRFLAQFTPFLADYISDGQIREIVEDSLDEFIRRNVLQYAKAKELPVHFTGSIAYNFRHNLIGIMCNHGLKTGKISQNPMEGLIQYYNYECK